MGPITRVGHYQQATPLYLHFSSSNYLHNVPAAPHVFLAPLPTISSHSVVAPAETGHVAGGTVGDILRQGSIYGCLCQA